MLARHLPLTGNHFFCFGFGFFCFFCCSGAMGVNDRISSWTEMAVVRFGVGATRWAVGFSFVHSWTEMAVVRFGACILGDSFLVGGRR
jgi:hypothetical protein